MPKVNETFVKKAAIPPASQKIYYDSEHPGFGLRVTKAGAKAFILNYHINKRERRFTIGKSPAWSAAAAREKARELRRMIDQGIDPLEERNERREAPTVGDLWSYQMATNSTLVDVIKSASSSFAKCDIRDASQLEGTGRRPKASASYVSQVNSRRSDLL